MFPTSLASLVSVLPPSKQSYPWSGFHSILTKQNRRHGGSTVQAKRRAKQMEVQRNGFAWEVVLREALVPAEKTEAEEESES